MRDRHAPVKQARPALAALTLAVVCLAGCGHPTSKATVNGVTYVIEGAPASISMLNDSIRADTPHGVLTVIDGEIVLAGEIYGHLKRGDRLTLQADGTLTVNGDVQVPETDDNPDDNPDDG